VVVGRGFLERGTREGSLLAVVVEKGILAFVGAVVESLFERERAEAAVLEVRVEGPSEVGAVWEVGLEIGLGSREAMVLSYFSCASSFASVLAVHSFPGHSGSWKQGIGPLSTSRRSAASTFWCARSRAS